MNSRNNLILQPARSEVKIGPACAYGNRLLDECFVLLLPSFLCFNYTNKLFILLLLI